MSQLVAFRWSLITWDGAVARLGASPIGFYFSYPFSRNTRPSTSDFSRCVKTVNLGQAFLRYSQVGVGCQFEYMLGLHKNMAGTDPYQGRKIETGSVFGNSN